MDWVKHAQPPIVILENVSGAPWDKKVKIFEDELGYHADFVRLDTKHYYIPQVCSILNSSPVTALLHSHHDKQLCTGWVCTPLDAPTISSYAL